MLQYIYTLYCIITMTDSASNDSSSLESQINELTRHIESTDQLYQQSLDQLNHKLNAQQELIDTLNKKYIKSKNDNVSLHTTNEQLKQLCRSMKIESKQLQSQLQQQSILLQKYQQSNPHTNHHHINNNTNNNNTQYHLHHTDTNESTPNKQLTIHTRTDSDKENGQPPSIKVLISSNKSMDSIQQPNKCVSPVLLQQNKKLITPQLPTQLQQHHSTTHTLLHDTTPHTPTHSELPVPTRSLVSSKPLLTVQSSLQLPSHLKPGTIRHKRHVSQTASLLRQSTQSLTLNSSICVNSIKSTQHNNNNNNNNNNNSNVAVVNKPRIFEQFMIVGCVPDIQYSTAQTKPYKRHHQPTSWHQSPTVLHTYGRSESSIDQVNDIAKFICPNDIKCDIIDMKRSTSDIMHILYGQQHLSPSSAWYTICLKIAANTHASTQSNNDTTLDSINEQQLDNLYGICIVTQEMCRILDVHTQQPTDITHQQTYCILTRYPYYELFFNTIQQLLKILHLKRLEHMATMNLQSQNELQCIQLPSISDMTSILDILYTTELPRDHQPTLTIKLQSEHNLVCGTDIVQNIPCSRYSDIQLIGRQHNIIAWHNITADIVVYLFELTLREYKIIVQHTDISIYTACVMSLLTLICPLQWVGVLLPTLPLSLIELVDSPVPYIVGVSQLPCSITPTTLNSYQCIYTPASNQIYLHHSFKSILYQRKQLVNKIDKQLQLLRSNRVDQRSTAAPAYIGTAIQYNIVDDIGMILKEYIVDCIDYIHDTRVQHGIIDSSKEPLASIMEHTQSADHYFQLMEQSIRERKH